MSLFGFLRSDRVDRYLELRERLCALQNTIVNTLDRKLMHACARRLGLFHGGSMVFENETEMSVFMDYCIYDHLIGGRNPVERYLDRHPPQPGTDGELVASAMLDASYRIIAIKSRRRGVGAQVDDILDGKEFFLNDIALSKTVRRGTLMAGRIVIADGIFMTTGASMPLQGETTLALILETGRLAGCVERLNRQHRDREARIEFSTMVIRACLETQASDRMGFLDAEEAAREVDPLSRFTSGPPRFLPDPDEEDFDTHRSGHHRPALAPAAVSGHGFVGPNHPCPCGSGRKFKKCCGRS